MLKIPEFRPGRGQFEMFQFLSFATQWIHSSTPHTKWRTKQNRSRSDFNWLQALQSSIVVKFTWTWNFETWFKESEVCWHDQRISQTVLCRYLVRFWVRGQAILLFEFQLSPKRSMKMSEHADDDGSSDLLSIYDVNLFQFYWWPKS